jgi:hypothetical protein
MEENNINISDEELHELLKSRLLSDDDSALTDKLTDMQADILFSAPAAIAPPPLKEKELLAQAGKKAAAFKLSFGWVFTSLSAAAAITITSVFLLKSEPQNTPQIVRPLNDQAPALYKAAPIQAEAAYAKPNDKANHEIKNRNSDSVATTATTMEPVTTMESAAPAASTQTVLPVTSATVLAVSETRTATPSVSDIKCAAAQPATSALKPPDQNSCRIWKTQDLCSTPNNLKYPYLIECDLCNYDVDCKELCKKGATAVIFRIYKKSGFTLDKGFKSIALVKPDGRKFEPLAISIDRYMSNVKKLRVKFTKVIDIVMLFPEAAPGDKVIIEGAGEAVVE